jgi:hypothetical protein
MTSAAARNRPIYDLLSPPLILLTPFISFVNHSDYSYSTPELWVSIVGLTTVGLLCAVVMTLGGAWLRVLGTAGLLTLFVDIQFEWFDTLAPVRLPAFAIGALLFCALLREHLSRIAVPVFATMLLTALLFQGTSSELPIPVAAQRPQPEATPTLAPPVVIHLIFDEFTGIEGVPPEASDANGVQHKLRTFLLENGFQVFGRAYSRFHRTINSIPNEFNYASVPDESHFVEKDSMRLIRNQYFSDMFERGYKIHVYQSDYLDFCSGYERQIASCRTFLGQEINPLRYLPLPVNTKTELTLRNFGNLSLVWRAGWRYYHRALRKAVSHGYLSPESLPGSFHLWSAHGLRVFETIARDVANAAPGAMYFAHLLIPHAPYVYDRSCKLRDPDNWVDRPDPVPRLRRYELYLDQVECVYNRLQEAFDMWRRARVFDRAKIIIQGDHGSRLYLTEPTVENRDELRESDYVDSFSTLLAVKAPGLEPRYDGRILAIQDALAAIANNEALDGLSVRADRPFVFLRNMRGRQMIKRPMPHFGDLPAE